MFTVFVDRVGYNDVPGVYFNRPIERSRRILQHLQTTFPASAVHPNSDQISIEQVEALQVHESAYLHFLQQAYENARASGDADWFKDDKLIPNHFYPGVLPIISRVPLYKQSGIYTNDVMTPIGSTSAPLAFQSAMTTCLAATHLLQMERTIGKPIVYALTCSPGHHAGPSRYAGYCFLNNAGIAAKYIHLQTGKRVAILDLDYHAGDGTQQMFYANSNVVTLSIHIDPTFDYPSFVGFADEHGKDQGIGYNYNFCFPPKATSTQYMILLSNALRVIRALECQYLVIAFGADTYKEDPDPANIAGAQLDIPDYFYIGASCRALGLPTLVTQEGGYNLDMVPKIVESFFHGLTT